MLLPQARLCYLKLAQEQHRVQFAEQLTIGDDLQVATAIRGAIIQAKMSCIPVRRGYWGNKIGTPHTVPTKVTGKCGSVTVRLIPAPRGAGIVAARVPKKVLQMAGIDDCYTVSRGSTKTLGNFVKVRLACTETCTYLILIESCVQCHPYCITNWSTCAWLLTSVCTAMMQLLACLKVMYISPQSFTVIYFLYLCRLHSTPCKRHTVS